MINLDSFLQSGGLLLIGLVIFAESGLLVGFFLPGDTLLFAAGFFAAQGKLPLGWLIFVATVAAILGYNVGYEIGNRYGPRVFKKPDGLIFRQSYLAKTEAFYNKHGGKTIILGRFVPYVRTLGSVMAGISKMSRRRFTIFNIIGAIFWVVSVTLLGVWLGSKIHVSIDHYILPVVSIAVLISFAPMIWHLLLDAESRRRLVLAIRQAPKFLQRKKS